MKMKLFLFSCSFCILSATCAQKVCSLHPLFTEQDAALIPEIEGLWRISDFDMTISFQKTGDNFYLLKYGSETNTSVFEAVFVKIKGEIILDLSGVMPDTIGDEDYRNTFIRSHSFYKIVLANEELQLYELNYSWFYGYALQNNASFKYEWVQGGMLMTLNTAGIKSFFIENHNTAELFKSSLSFKKEPTKVAPKKSISRLELSSEPTSIISQKCIPEFPLKDGWQGGDGDVSVPINATTTLFIFSDTYVGNKHEHSRNGAEMKMISNSVAVTTCLSNGDTDVNYFWNNMYSENPEPIFKSYTSRYKYWVTSAFMIKGNLYATLEKIGTKPGTAPDDIFSFSLLGFTLAKISNPYDTPEAWTIEYIPLNDFKNPAMGLGPPVILENYIYFFVSRFDKFQVLLRKQIDFIDNAQKPFEHYALDKQWKLGLKTSDLDTIVNGFRSTTVNYHKEMNQWVMICDIAFMDNKIKMRTASALTGPWSEEITIYEIPEVTPGNPAYSKTNFCYLARECIQNYNSEKHEMLVTYDVNNSDFSQIKSNLGIYTPKIVVLPLK